MCSEVQTPSQTCCARGAHDMDIRPTILSLFSGYGGLELGLGRVLGSTRVLAYVEREAYAAANLVAAMQAEALAPAPIWSDVQTFDASGIRPDLLTAGIPCQPFSTAGKRQHTDDERWVWSDVARIIGECRPGTVFLECTPGIRRRGLPVILRDLAGHGYDAAWTCDSRASDAGAPHRRSRFFLVAHSDGQQLRHNEQRQAGGRHHLQDGGEALAGHNGEAMAYPGSQRLSEQRTSHDDDGCDASGHEPHRCSAGVGNADGTRPSEHASVGEDARAQQPATERAGRTVEFPPGPDDADGWRRYIAAGGPQPGIRGGIAGPADRVDRVRLVGNGVCPGQAAQAFRELSSLLLHSGEQR